MFITEAIAQTAGGSGGGAGGLSSILPLILIFAVFYLFLIHPQKKKYKEHQKMLSEVKKGDNVVTVGGIMGKIVHVDEDFINLEIAPDVKIKLSKSSIADVIRPKPVNENKDS